MKILGEGADLLCKRTNERANRVLSRSTSEAHKSRWKDLMNGPRLWTFLGVKLGLVILRVGPRHLMKQEPSWISQQGDFLKSYPVICTDYGAHTLWLTHIEIQCWSKDL